MDRLSCGLEVKFAADVADGTFSGYGAVFDNEDRGGDVILKGAFKESIRDAKKSGVWPAMLLQHGGVWGGSVEDQLPIGIWTDLREDDKGLYVEGKLAVMTDRGKDIYALLKMDPRPALQGLSIGYRAKEFIYGTKPGEAPRTLKKVDLFEISLVGMAMNPMAQIDAVKSVRRFKTIREFETFLRDEGRFSHAAAKAIAAGGFKAFTPDPRDEDGIGEAIAGPFKALAELIRS